MIHYEEVETPRAPAREGNSTFLPQFCCVVRPAQIIPNTDEPATRQLHNIKIKRLKGPFLLSIECISKVYIVLLISGTYRK